MATNFNGTIKASDDSQTLESATLYSVFTKNGVKIAQYQVDYTSFGKSDSIQIPSIGFSFKWYINIFH